MVHRFVLTVMFILHRFYLRCLVFDFIINHAQIVPAGLQHMPRRLQAAQSRH